MKDLLTILENPDEEKVGVVSLTENIDSTTAAGRAMMRMVESGRAKAEVARLFNVHLGIISRLSTAQ